MQNRSPSSLPTRGDLRGQRRRRPGVHDVGVADEAARLAPLIFGETLRGIGYGSTGSNDSSGVIGSS